MKRETVIEKLTEIVNDYFDTQEIQTRAQIDTVLFGNDSVLDSMGLVNVIIDTESRFLDEDIEISLTSESAMSRRNSPFRTIQTLADYIMEQIEAKDE